MQNSFKNKTVFVERLGQGTQGIVEKHLFESKEVAVKKYFSTNDKDIDASTLRELNIFQKLKNCPTINQLLDVHVLIKSSIELQIMMPYYAYDLTKLSSTLSEKSKINQLPLIMNQMFNALYNLYHIGVIHTDIKPDNILADIVDNKIQLKLADFGLALQLPCEFSYRHLKNPIHGTPLYMAPEILTSNQYYNEKVDIWSTAITVLYFLIGEVTNPSDELMNFADDFGLLAVIYQIVEISTNNIYPDIKIYDQIKENKYYDVVNVDKLLKKLDHYDLIPSGVIKALTSMLEINPEDRISITDLYNGKLCSISSTLPRGDMKTPMIDMYYDTVFKLIQCCDKLNVNPMTCYLSIDLFERYLANFDVTKQNINVYAASSLIINIKLYDKMDLDFYDFVQYFDKTFTINELSHTQLLFLKRFDYLITTCETDEFLNLLNNEMTSYLNNYNFSTVLKSLKLHGDMLEEFKISYINNKMVYPTLYKMYKNIQKDNLYAGNMFNFELVEYYEKI